jgi:hypothetical protein
MTTDRLSATELKNLRENNLLTNDEFAYRAGDLLIAENPTTGEKRVIGQADLIVETNKRILKG